MTDTTHKAPERIWITGSHNSGSWNSTKTPADWLLTSETEYIRADTAQAMVAAALREAANQTPRHYGVWSATGVHVGVWDDGVDAAKALAEYPGGVMRDLIDVNTILALITPDAQTALDRALAAERDALKEAVDEVTEYAKRHEAERDALADKLDKAERALRKISKHDLQRIAMTALRANWLDLHARGLALVEIAKHDTQGWALAALAELKKREG